MVKINVVRAMAATTPGTARAIMVRRLRQNCWKSRCREPSKSRPGRKMENNRGLVKWGGCRKCPMPSSSPASTRATV